MLFKYRLMFFRRFLVKLFRRYEFLIFGFLIYVSIDDFLLFRILKIKYLSNLVFCYKGCMYLNGIEI